MRLLFLRTEIILELCMPKGSRNGICNTLKVEKIPRIMNLNFLQILNVVERTSGFCCCFLTI